MTLVAWIAPTPLRQLCPYRPCQRSHSRIVNSAPVADSPGNMAGKVGFLGCGNMGRAILTRLVYEAVLSPHDVYASARTEATLEQLHAVGVPPAQLLLSHENSRLVRECDVVVLGVKPQGAMAALRGVSDAFDPARHILVSLVAGVSATAQADALRRKDSDDPAHVVRAIPTIAAVVGASVTAVVSGPHATGQDLARCVELFRACGHVEVLADEHQLHAATALLLPIFTFVALEALADAAVLEGLPRDVARRCAAQSLRSASTLAAESPHVHPGTLRNDVESPAGVTIRATRELERGGYRASIMNAVSAATERSIELGSS